MVKCTWCRKVDNESDRQECGLSRGSDVKRRSVPIKNKHISFITICQISNYTIQPQKRLQYCTKQRMSLT